MIIYFNLVMIFIIILYIANSYFLSVKQNSIKFFSFLLRILLAWVIAKGLSGHILDLSISSSRYEYIINGEVINNIVDIFKVLLVQNFPDFTFIINERSAAIYIIESISIMLIRSILMIIVYFFISLVYKVSLIIRKKRDKKNKKIENEISKIKGIMFGAFHGLIVVFIICIPISGISSLTNDISRLDNNNDLSNEIVVFNDYRKTITGKVISYININNKPLDVYFFDRIFSVDIKKDVIFISDEVRTFIDIIEIIEDKNLTQIDENTLISLDEDFINEFILRINELKSLNISAPLLIDYFLINNLDITLEEEVYAVDYYNDSIILKDISLLYIKEYEKIDDEDIFNNDFHLLLEFLENLSNLDLLEKLSLDISREVMKNEIVFEYLAIDSYEAINLTNVNYKKEVGLLKEILDIILEVEEPFTNQTIEKLSELVASSNLLMDNDEVILDLFIENYLTDFNQKINRFPLEINDIKSLIRIAKVFVDNGFMDPYFRLSKLNDDYTVDIIVEALTESNLLVNNLDSIFKLYLKACEMEIDFELIIAEEIDFRSKEGKKELKDFFRIFQILNFGVTQENLEEHLDELCDILNDSRMIKENLNYFIESVIKKYNTSNYEIYVFNIDYLSPEGDVEIKNIIEAIKLIVNKKVIDSGIAALFSFSKEDIEVFLSSRLIEEASIHLLYDIGRTDDIPLVVNIELDDPVWYKSARNAGELRNFIYAIKIIFKDVESLAEIELTPDLIFGIDDGTIDTNNDGIVDERDENELIEIMKSKILMDSVVKYIYDYYKNLN